MWQRRTGKGRRPPRRPSAVGSARRKPVRPAAGRPAAPRAAGRRWPRRWAAVVRWFVLRPIRLWWTQGWLGRLLARWLGTGAPGAQRDGTARGLQQR